MRLSEVIEMRDKLARIVADDGEVFLPIFMRLDEEVTRRQAREEALSKVRQIVTQNGTHSEKTGNSASASF